MLRIVIGVEIFVLCIMNSFPCMAQETVEHAIVRPLSTNIVAEILPRVELLSGVLSHTSWMNTRGPRNRGSRYFQALQEFFIPYQEHDAIQLAEALTQAGFTYDAPPAFLLSLSPLPELDATSGYSEYLVQRADGEEKLEAFRMALRQLAEESDFLTFFQQQRQQLERALDASLTGFAAEQVTEWLIEFYGWSGDEFHLVFAPGMCCGGGYGATINTEDATVIAQVIRAYDRHEGAPQFCDGDELLRLTLHELSHSFVNPAVAQHADLFQKLELSAFYLPVERIMKAQAYGRIETFFDEMLVRAATILGMQDLAPESSPFQQMVSAEMARGFYGIEFTLSQFRYYREHRDEFPRFESFVPYLFHQFVAQKESLLQQIATLPQPINRVFKEGDKAVYIVPTHETNQTTQDSIRAYVQKMRDRFRQNARILTDDEALLLDLSDTVVICYGTLNGNAWIRENLHTLPLEMTEEHLVADEVYQGKSFRFITTWPHPQNPDRHVVVYTAQRAEDVVGINSVFHGPTEYVVARQQEVVTSANYDKANHQWQFK
jgi:hypothetical protein